jgi:hypothetical protein
MSIHTIDQIVGCMAIEGNLERQEAEILHHVEKFAMQSTPDLSSPGRHRKRLFLISIKICMPLQDLKSYRLHLSSGM